jgi:hypothetical protein
MANCDHPGEYIAGNLKLCTTPGCPSERLSSRKAREGTKAPASPAADRLKRVGLSRYFSSRAARDDLAADLRAGDIRGLVDGTEFTPTVTYGPVATRYPYMLRVQAHVALRLTVIHDGIDYYVVTEASPADPILVDTFDYDSTGANWRRSRSIP